MMRSISLTCRAPSTDQASNGFPASGRMFFPGTDLLPPLAGTIAMTRFPLSMGLGVPGSSFDGRPCAEATETVQCFAVFGPLPSVHPRILAYREDADAPTALLDLLDEIGHVTP